MILCFNFKISQRSFSCSNLKRFWLNIKLIIIFCAIWNYQGLDRVISTSYPSCNYLYCLDYLH